MNYTHTSTRARLKILDCIYNARKGHIGGALSIVDFLVYAYGSKLVLPSPLNRPVSSTCPLILSKGHSATALLATLALFYPDEAFSLDNYNSSGSLVGNNPSELVFGVEFHSGSLGHGLGFSCGLSLADKLAGFNRRIITVVSDGELHEGSCWESLMFAVQHSLNMVIIVDKNNQICEDIISNVIDHGNLKSRFEAFGFSCVQVDGHDFDAFSKIVTPFVLNNKSPRVVILDTIKGKGISFMEQSIRFHHGIPSSSEYSQAVSELSSNLHS